MTETAAPGHSAAGTAPDPRTVITPDAFRVAPRLLGLRLAGPWRRGFAMAADGLLIAMLSGGPSILFGAAAAAVLFRVSGKPAPGGYIRRSVRGILRVTAAIIVFGLAVAAWGSIAGRLSGDDEADERSPGVSVDGVTGVELTGIAGARAAADIARLALTADEEEARALLARSVPALRDAGMSDEDIREMVEGFAERPGREWMAAVDDAVLGPPEEAEAVAVADTAPAVPDTVATLISAIAESERRNEVLADRIDQLEDEAEEGIGIMAMLRSFADDLGLGIGWAGLYFTTFLTLWKGRTPGKRMLGVRVIRLDGEELGWWASFGRFGGYAAGVATGLLGFAQIFWDRNRQAVHDKISETVVIREERR